MNRAVPSAGDRVGPMVPAAAGALRVAVLAALASSCRADDEPQKTAIGSSKVAPQPPSGQPAWMAPLQRGFGLQQANRWAEAAEAYAQCVSLSADGPWSSEAQRLQVVTTVGTNYGLSLQKLGRDAEAVASYDRALTLQPSNADNHHNRGNALYSASRYGEAAAAFTTAVTLQPRDGESYFNLGNSCARH